jgi:hypothetical protein
MLLVLNLTKTVDFANANGAKLFQGMIESLPHLTSKNIPRRINAIVMDDVLEHLAFPSRNMRTISRCQQNGDFYFLDKWI